MKANSLQTYEVLDSLTRQEVRNIAITLGVPRGKDKKNTIANLARAIADGKAQFKSVVTIYANPQPGSLNTHGKTLLSKKFRTYKDDKVLYPVPLVK